MTPANTAVHPLAQRPTLAPAAIYIRVSMPGQAVDGYSLQTQLPICQAYATQYGFHIDDRHIFVEQETGTTMGRVALSALREVVQQGLIKAVIIFSWDRFGRDLGDQLVLIKEFRRCGVQVYDTGAAPAAPSPQRDFLMQIQGAVAQYEHAQILERTERGRRGRAQAGNPCVQKVPLGYRYEGTAHQGCWVVVEDEAAVVRLIFHLYVEDQLTMYQIALRLRTQGVTTFAERRVREVPAARASRWYTTYIQRILTNTAYVGMVYYGKAHRTYHAARTDKKTAWEGTPRETWIAIPVPPIISQPLWDAAQRQRQMNAKHSRRNQKRPYLLGGQRLRCGVCKMVMSGTASHGVPYYRCNELSPAVAPYCRRLVRADWIEPAIWEEVTQMVDDSDYLRTLIEQQPEATSHLERQHERARLEQELANLTARMQRWEAAYEDASITLATFKAKRQPLEAHQALAQARMLLLAEESQRDLIWDTEWEELAAWLHGLKATLPTLDAAGRQDVLTTLGLEVIYEADKKLRLRVGRRIGSQASKGTGSNRTTLTWTLAS